MANRTALAIWNLQKLLDEPDTQVVLSRSEDGRGVTAVVFRGKFDSMTEGPDVVTVCAAISWHPGRIVTLDRSGRVIDVAKDE